MTRAEFHPDAKAEMIEAASFYESQSSGLGKRFLEATRATLQHIQLNPSIYQRVESKIRRAKVTKFPFGLIFRTQDDYIEILAVLHFRRRPGYWRYRIKSEHP